MSESARVRDKDAGCVGKSRFASAHSAHVAFGRMRHPKLNVYRCEFCGGWHIGTRERIPKPRPPQQ